jgi:hypothetical protein
MRIIVNHLTRMQPGYVCVAGYEPNSMEHIRPVLGRRLKRALIGAEGGPFDLGIEVELGSVRYVGAAPEVEDHEFTEASVEVVDRVPEDRFWRDLQRLLSPDLFAAFGERLERRGNGFAVSLGQGDASLACIVPDSRPTFEVNPWGSLRCEFEVDGEWADLAVTDIRLCKSDQKTIKAELVDELNRRSTTGVDLIFAVGLTRPWRRPRDRKERHWLQVNNVFFEDDPYLTDPA